MAGHRLRKIAFGDEAQPRQQLEQSIGCIRLKPECPVETTGIKLPRPDKRLAELPFRYAVTFSSALHCDPALSDGLLRS